MGNVSLLIFKKTQQANSEEDTYDLTKYFDLQLDFQGLCEL